jgi:hypothetical protein
MSDLQKNAQSPYDVPALIADPEKTDEKHIKRCIF